MLEELLSAKEQKFRTGDRTDFVGEIMRVLQNGRLREMVARRRQRVDALQAERCRAAMAETSSETSCKPSPPLWKLRSLTSRPVHDP